MRSEPTHEDVAAAVRDRLRAADEEITVPGGLWESVRASSPAVVPEARARRRRRAPGPPFRLPALVAAGAVAAAVAAVAYGAWWLARPATTGPAATPPVALSVHNAEAPCRTLRTLECALRLARDPYAAYAAEGNSAGRVWHGERLAAVCVVTDGTLVRDEAGVSSTRWYLVRSADGTRGWLPGVRTRNTTETRACTTDERAPRTG